MSEASFEEALTQAAGQVRESFDQLRLDLDHARAELAEDIDRGEADWERFLRGHDGRRELLEQMVEAAQDRFGEEARQAFADSESPSDVEDPRPGR